MKFNETILPIILIACYFVLMILWVMRGYPRVQKRIVQWLRDRLGKPIEVVQAGRTENWEIRAEHSIGEGCFVFFVQMFAVMGCLAGPLFGMLIVITIIVVSANGGF